MGAKCILHAENAPTIHTFEYSVIGSNSQYPYLLGFNSNLIPNSCNFNISVTSLGGFRIFGMIRDICVYICSFTWENPE